MTDEEFVLQHIPQEHRERFKRCVLQANASFGKLPDEDRGALSMFTTIRSGYLWAKMAQAAQREFASTNVRVRIVHGTMTFSFAGHILVQLTKMTKGRVRPGRTNRAKAFQQQLAIPGEPERIHVYVGYETNKHGIELKRVVMVQPDGPAKLSWSHEIEVSEQDSLIAEITRPEEQEQRSRVRPKEDTEAQRFRKLTGESRENDATESA